MSLGKVEALEMLLALSPDDAEASVALAGRLDWSPKKNWVEDEGGLPRFIEDIAVALVKDGHDRSKAIAIAVSRVKKWAAGGEDVKADTRAKAVKAVAEWEKMKASAKAKREKKD